MTSDAIGWLNTAREAARREDGMLVGVREWIRAAIVGGAVATDVSLIFLGCMTGALVRYGNAAEGHVLELTLAFSPAYILGCLVLGAYSLDVLRSTWKSVGFALLALLIAAGVALAIAFGFYVSAFVSRVEAGCALAAAGTYLVIGRAFGASLINQLRSVVDPTILVLGDHTAGRFSGAGDRQIDVFKRGWTAQVNDPHFLTELFDCVRHSDRVLLIFDDIEERKKWAQVMRLTGVDAEIVDPNLSDATPLAIGDWDGTPTLVISRGPLSLGERIVKRAFDFGIVTALAPIVLPLIGAAAILIRLESPGPALFVQERLGRNNRRYKCYKLRSMRCEHVDPAGVRSTERDDDRVTRIGGFLRRTSLDELPQLWNVLVGDMSLVGPRPHALGSTAEGALFWEVVEGYWTRHSVKPGITGLAQTRGLRGATLSREDIEKRVASDLEYINHWSVWLDIKLIVKTLKVIIHRNAFSFGRWPTEAERVVTTTQRDIPN